VKCCSGKRRLGKRHSGKRCLGKSCLGKSFGETSFGELPWYLFLVSLCKIKGYMNGAVSCWFERLEFPKFSCLNHFLTRAAICSAVERSSKKL
jgi:hypothetical protein